MKNKIYFFTFIILSALVFLHTLSLKESMSQHKSRRLITDRAYLIHSIKPELADLEDRLWGIISVYDPRQGRKVNLNELRYSEKIGTILGAIDAAAAMTKDNQLLLQFDIVRRSVRSLATRIDAIKERLNMKQMDEESTELVFSNPKRVIMLSESYVDEMKTLLEQVRFARKVIEGHISKYDAIEIQMVGLESDAGEKIDRRWVLINRISWITIFVLTVILFGTVTCKCA